MNVAVVMTDLMFYSRIEAQALRAGARVTRLDSVDELAGEAGLDLVLVDWNERSDGWADVLTALAAPSARIILFGRHTDLEAHDAARATGLGPMWARSRVLTRLPDLLPVRR